MCVCVSVCMRCVCVCVSVSCVSVSCVCPPVHLSVFVCPSAYLPVCLSAHLSICPPLCVRLPICLPVCLSVRPSARLCVEGKQHNIKNKKIHAFRSPRLGPCLICSRARNSTSGTASASSSCATAARGCKPWHQRQHNVPPRLFKT